MTQEDLAPPLDDYGRVSPYHLNHSSFPRSLEESGCKNSPKDGIPDLEDGKTAMIGVSCVRKN